ncbi:MAG: hypothetical protein ABFD64_01150 [Armatimonadota bacterium]
MRVSPVKSYIEPKYPTSRILEEHPELLKLVPKRWQRNAVVLTALAGVCFLSTGLKAQTDAKSSKQAVPDKKPAASKAMIAPIFKHGDGFGAFGCIAVNPPVFLSEEEARQVIVEEAKRAGIIFKADGREVRNIKMEVVDTETLDDSYRPKPKPKNLNLVLDGYDQKHNISYEYLSESDHKAWNLDTSCGTVIDYDMKGNAVNLVSALAAAKPAGTFAVFYDPCMGRVEVKQQLNGKSDKEIDPWDFSNEGPEFWKTVDVKAKDLAREALRNQVKDFISWLKAEGVI